MTEATFWADAWLDSLATGATTMSQRAVTFIEGKAGLKPVIAAARARGVHFLQLTDDMGKVLIAASQHPFVTLC